MISSSGYVAEDVLNRNRLYPYSIGFLQWLFLLCWFLLSGFFISFVALMHQGGDTHAQIISLRL